MIKEGAGRIGDRSGASRACELMKKELRWVVLILAVAVPAVLNPDFRSYENFQGFLQSIGILLILSMGQSFVLLIAGIDLSVGAVLALCSVILATLLQLGVPLTVATLLTVTVGLGVGVLNGALVLILKIPSFIVTFAMIGVAFSAALTLSGGNRIALPSSSPLPMLATSEFIGIPFQIILALVLLLIGSVGLRYLPTGRHLYAIGGNAEAARLSGISIKAGTLLAFGVSSLFASIAGVIYTARIVSGNPIAGGNLNLQSIAAAVIGGVSLFGGKGTLAGACFGAILYSVIENVLTIYNVNPNVTEIIAGAIVILAGLMNVLTDAKGSRS